MLLSALKVGLIAAASVGATLAVTGAGNFQGPNVVGLQFPLNSGGLKVAPDPSNVFSWDAAGIPRPGPGLSGDHSVCIDVDSNGVADQLQSGLSVLITDCFALPSGLPTSIRLLSIDAGGQERELWSSRYNDVQVSTSSPTPLYSPNSPIVVPSGSQLVLRLEPGIYPEPVLRPRDFRIHGRVVSH